MRENRKKSQNFCFTRCGGERLSAESRKVDRLDVGAFNVDRLDVGALNVDRLDDGAREVDRLDFGARLDESHPAAISGIKRLVLGQRRSLEECLVPETRKNITARTSRFFTFDQTYQL